MKSFSLAGTVLLVGCVTPAPTYEEAQSSKLITANYRAADQLLSDVRLDAAKPILTATLVSIDDLSQSSRLGRLISEQIASRLAQHGLPVIEMKMRGSIFMHQSQGELLLSREVKDISASHRAQAVVVGTYAPAQDYVYVTLKLVRSVDNLVLAAHNYALPLDGNIASLLPGLALR